MRHLVLTIMILTSLTFTPVFSSDGMSYYTEAQKAAGNGKIKDAVKLMNRAVEEDPDNSELFCYLGDMCGVMAQQASIFSKFSWAKKCKKAYLKAVDLDGKNIRAKMSLMRFLILAPGIAGGSDKKGLEQAKEIYKMSPLMGNFSFAFIANTDKKFDEAVKHITEAVTADDKKPAFPEKWYRRFALRVIEHTGQRLGKKKKFSESDKIFSLGLTMFSDEFSHLMSRS